MMMVNKPNVFYYFLTSSSVSISASTSATASSCSGAWSTDSNVRTDKTVRAAFVHLI